ncbi:protein kinase domain-containing protein [Kytococcus sp. Marseille-QA3725]
MNDRGAETHLPDAFEPVQRLGGGSSAEVWLARHRVTGRDVALKVWWTPVDDLAREAFRVESRHMAAVVGEPHLVQLLWAAGPRDEHVWLATAAAGRDLPRWIRERGGISGEEARDVVRQMLVGLDALHRRGLTHRDVNPNNLLVGRDGEVVLADFGLVVGPDDRVADPAAGTEGHVAPELSAGGRPDPRSDVYSAAVVADALLGEDVPPAVEQVLLRASSHRPEDRPADAGEFLRLLDEFEGGFGQRRTGGGELAGASAVSTGPGQGGTGAGGRRGAVGRMAGLAVAAALLAAGALWTVDTLRDGGTGEGVAQTPATGVEGESPSTGPSTGSGTGGSSPVKGGAPMSPPPFPGQKKFTIGAEMDVVEDLDHALIDKGCTQHHDGDGYQPGRTFTEATRANVAHFQRSNPELAGDPDGIPGPLTWDMLFSPSSVPCQPATS